MSERTKYTLGEIIEITTTIRNKTSKPIAIGGDNKSWVVIKIASGEDKDYKMYVRPGNSFILDGINIGVTIQPHKTLSLKETIFWNQKPDVSHLNSDAAKAYTDGRILTDYAFPVSGKYFVKLFAHIELKGVSADYDSLPLELDLSEPSGADATIWNKIKQDGDVGNFLHTSEFPRPRAHWIDEQNAFERKILALIDESPNGIYAKTFRENLDKNLAKYSPRAGYYNPFYFNEAMTLSAVTDKSEYLRSEPIGLICKFSNDTQKPQITVLPDFINESRLIVTPSNNGKYYYPVSGLRSAVLRRPLTFQPRVAVEQSIVFDANLDEMFPHRGTYTLKLSLQSLNGPIESNPLQITISEPAGLDKEAWEFIRRHKEFLQSSQVFGWWDHVKLDGRHTILEEFVNKYGESVYGEVAALRLGIYYFRRNEKSRARPVLERAARSKKPSIAADAKYFLDRLREP